MLRCIGMMPVSRGTLQMDQVRLPHVPASPPHLAGRAGRPRGRVAGAQPRVARHRASPRATAGGGPADPGLPGRRRLAGAHDALAARPRLPHPPGRHPRPRGLLGRASCTALEDRLERMADKTGERVSIVGQSRGGIIARALAVPPAGPRRRASSRSARPCAACSTCTRWCSARSASSARSARCACRTCSRGAACAASAARSSGAALEAATSPRTSATPPSTPAATASCDWRACLDPAAARARRGPLLALRDGGAPRRLRRRRAARWRPSGRRRRARSGPSGPRRPSRAPAAPRTRCAASAGTCRPGGRARST